MSQATAALHHTAAATCAYRDATFIGHASEEVDNCTRRAALQRHAEALVVADGAVDELG